MACQQFPRTERRMLKEWTLGCVGDQVGGGNCGGRAPKVNGNVLSSARGIETEKKGKLNGPCVTTEKNERRVVKHKRKKRPPDQTKKKPKSRKRNKTRDFYWGIILVRKTWHSILWVRGPRKGWGEESMRGSLWE